MLRVTSDKNNIWQSFKEGSRKAFQQIYDENFDALLAYGMRLTQDKELIKDAVHDLFVKIYNNKNNLADVNNIRAYLFISLRSNFLNKITKETKVVSTEYNELFPFDLNFSVENEFIKKDADASKVNSVVEGFNRLSPRQKEIIYLHYYQELSYDEIAEILGITVKASYKLNARALEALKNVLSLLVVSNFSLLLKGLT